MSSRPVVDVAFVILDVDFMLENAPVFQTQVGEQLLALQAAGLQTALVTTSRSPEVFDRVIGRRLAAAGVRVALSRHGGLISNLLRLARKLRTEARDIEVRHAYVRGIWGRVVLALAFPRRGLPFVYDVRGALVDETHAAGTPRWRARVFRRLERWSVRTAAGVTAVSQPLAQQIAREYGRLDVTVVPSCVPVRAMEVSIEERAAARRRLGFAPSDLVLTYCGGLDSYQQIPQMLALWERLLELEDVRYLLLINEAPHRGPSTLPTDRFGPRLQRRSVTRAEVAGLLAAGDVGFLLREARTMNRTASPVKFAEYLAAGLAVVASPGIGDLSELIEREDIGVLVATDGIPAGAEAVRTFLGRLRHERALVRERARAIAASRYDWNAHLPTFRRFYASAKTDTNQVCAAS